MPCRGALVRIVDNRRNYYRILHVQPDAPVEIIKSSYRTLMQRLKQHPDLGGDHWNAALINEAYRVLTHPMRREQYDRERELIQRGSSTAEPTKDAASESTDKPQADATTAPIADATCLFCLVTHDHTTSDDPADQCPNCASPLCLAADWQLEDSGQRTINRVPKRLEIEFYTTWPQATACAGQTLDLSPNGLRFMTQRRLNEGRCIKITSSALDAIARVTHCQRDSEQGQWVVGVSFETIRILQSQGAFFSGEA